MADEAPLHPGIGLVDWEEHEMARLRADTFVTDTVRQAVVEARRGQGLFKERVMKIERACRITGVTQEEHLRASHCKPWPTSNTLSAWGLIQAARAMSARSRQDSGAISSSTARTCCCGRGFLRAVETRFTGDRAGVT
jgi:hypothetical protein